MGHFVKHESTEFNHRSITALPYVDFCQWKSAIDRSCYMLERSLNIEAIFGQQILDNVGDRFKMCPIQKGLLKQSILKQLLV